MTLIIAGHDHTTALDYYSFGRHPSPNPKKMEKNGLFCVADSAITSHRGSRTLLNGFRKIHFLEAKLWAPEFYPDGSFNTYLNVHETRNLFIAFAGSTLTAQHILNTITEHLSSLRISYTRKEDTGRIQYCVIRHCQKNPLNGPEPAYWEDDTFLREDFENLLTGKIISEIIEHSMNHALRSAASYKLSLEEFNSMRTEIVAGFWCPVSRCHELYVYRMLSKQGDDGVLSAYTEAALVPPDEVVVLGMRTEFDQNAQLAFKEALASQTPPSQVMWSFLESAIDTVQDRESKEIDRPTVLKKLLKNEINKSVRL